MVTAPIPTEEVDGVGINRLNNSYLMPAAVNAASNADEFK